MVSNLVITTKNAVIFLKIVHYRIFDIGQIQGTFRQKKIPFEEVRHLLEEDDSALVRTKDGFRIKRGGRKSVVYKGEIKELKMIRDEYILEVFVNGGEEIYSVLL